MNSITRTPLKYEVVRWEDPDENTRGRRPTIAPIVRELKKNPGEWAVVTEEAKSASVTAGWTRSGCEATARSNGDGTWTIYARWNNE